MSHRPPLDPAAFAPEPMQTFDAWFEDARACGEPEPEACALATAGESGMPSVRMVLLRGADARGFVFYTNDQSRKGGELAARPLAALTFYWRAAGRQVRVEGRVERVSAAESDAYFRSRSRDSRLGAIASPQSRPLRDRADLEARYRRVAAAYPSGEVPRPAHWGGFRLLPVRVEFWQSGPHRLHDRLVYLSDGNGWKIERLAP